MLRGCFQRKGLRVTIASKSTPRGAGRLATSRSGATAFGIPFADASAAFLCYAIAHGGIFLLWRAIFWDDWTLWNHSVADVLDTFRQQGSMFDFFGRVHVAMLAAGPWLYRVLTFVLMYGCGLFLYHILGGTRLVRAEDRLLLTILFLTAPFYAERVALIDFPYTVCVFCFFAGWFLLGKNRILALLCFLVSFNTESLLVFYALPMLEYCLRLTRINRLSDLLLWGLRHLDFLSAPLVWFAVKIAFFKPYGIYAGYNEQFSAENLLRAPLYQLRDMALSLPLPLVLAGAIIGLLVARHVPLVQLTVNTRPPERGRYLLIALLALFLGLFPYWILGHVPTFSEWTTRHQLLMPLGTAFLCVSAVAACPDRIQRRLAFVFIGIFLTLDLNNYARLALDWRKEQNIMGFLKQSREAASANLVLFDDNTPNALSRRYRFYEWNGLMKRAYAGDTSRFGIYPDDLERYRSGAFDDDFSVHFNADEHRRGAGPIVRIAIRGDLLRQEISSEAPQADPP